MTEIVGPTTVRSFGFNIPCRRFLIRANVTHDRRLPVVDEFVLRALKLCEDVPVRRLATYFGFSVAETEKVMGDLMAAGLVIVDGDNARLHPSAHEHFRGSEDGAPQIVEVDSWVERLWFDLVSRNMAAPDRARMVRSHLIDIRPSDMARDLPASYAMKAFEQNFAEYLRRVRRMRNPNRFALYSVSESIAERFGSLVFRMEEELVFDSEPHLRPNLLTIEAEEMPRFTKLATAMLDAYRGLNWMSSSATALAEFSGLSGESTVTDAYGGSARFDLGRWLSLNPDKMPPNRRNLVGASYIHRNVNSLVDLIDDLSKSPPSVDLAKEHEIVWYRPGGSGWGCSPELQEAIQSIKFALRRKFGKGPIRTKLICPSVSRRDHPERFKNLFDEGFFAPAGFLSPAVEIVHIPEVATLMLVNVALSASVEIPVGFASTAAQPLERAARKLARVDVKFDEIWKGERREEDELLPSPPEVDDNSDD